MTKRRFDTDVLLTQLLEGDMDAFRAFYERYRARVYRYIPRQCGNGDEGMTVYRCVWANLVEYRKHCNDVKDLKHKFLAALQRPSFKSPHSSRQKTLLALMPKKLDEEGGWTTLLIELIRRLPEDLRKRFLFRSEIGLNLKAIAKLFREQPEVTRRLIEEAERTLLDGLLRAGCNKEVSLEKLYRDTRVLKPPASWDDEIISAYPRWFQEGVPAVLLEPSGDEAKGRVALVQGFLRKTISHIRPVAADKSLPAPHSDQRRS